MNLCCPHFNKSWNKELENDEDDDKNLYKHLEVLMSRLEIGSIHSGRRAVDNKTKKCEKTQEELNAL